MLFYREIPHKPDELGPKPPRRNGHAIRNAETWGEFKALMPTKDFAEVLDSYVDVISYDGKEDDVVEPPSETEP